MNTDTDLLWLEYLPEIYLIRFETRRVRMIGSKGRADSDDASHEEEEDVDLSDLPAVQLKVLDRMRRGKTIKAIALELHLPQRTIKLYVRQGLRHLRARDRETLLSLIRRPH